MMLIRGPDYTVCDAFIDDLFYLPQFPQTTAHVVKSTGKHEIL